MNRSASEKGLSVSTEKKTKAFEAIFKWIKKTTKLNLYDITGCIDTRPLPKGS